MQATSPVMVATPTIRRRVSAMLYEFFLLLSVLILAVALYLLVTLNSQHPVAEVGRNVFVLLVTAAYFIYCWTDSGHTLAMKTWRIKVVKLGHARVPIKAAALRFVFAWGWFLPALLVSWGFGLRGKEVALAMMVGIVAWALTAFLDKDRQFLHDRLAGTRLIALPKAVRK
ncbi:RDD family protein [Massilia sp. H6]|uniref:RDD family protein n=1 Tax=Massilia sp. H6 TaxID=2970464 RepID=UPI00216983A0|nr:RDD family protein [Massilia sp. H6]UVW27602.1 RDD family protein [Massilia sp. H6]